MEKEKINLPYCKNKNTNISETITIKEKKVTFPVSSKAIIILSKYDKYPIKN